ncbi:Conserved_hypothetical protein [Hexamita inflata]|uniref:Uncharacterized protein n=1 Tax=Hexamita inflata TaxID=28002 RepID=A0AA86PZJ3_9EUKA|nr:Conserved hypothetical protein [Hexamita inflata]
MSIKSPEIKSFVISEEMQFFKEEYQNCKKVEIKLANMPKLKDVPSSVEQLFALKCGLTSIKNLRIAVNLTVVDLSDNLLTSIADLRFLTNIQVLNLARNNLIDISPIGELKKIVELNVQGNYAINFLPILNLPNFKPIMISKQNTAQDTDFQIFLNPEESVEDAIKRMNVELKLKLYSDYCCMMILRYESKVEKDGTLRINNDSELTYTTFTDSINVKNLIIENCVNVLLQKDNYKTLPKKVTNLSITNCGLTKLDGIEQMTQLLEIDVSNNKLLIVEPLLGIPSLQTVKLDGNYVQDLYVLQELRSNYWPLATKQNIPDQTILDDHIDHASEQEKAKYTGLMQSQKEKNEQIVYDAFQITKLKDYMKSGELTIKNDDSIISTQFLDFFTTFFNIKKIILDNCQNVKFIRNPIKITDLSIINSKIKDLKGLEQMKQLKKLNLSGNSIRDITAISSLTELTSLVLNHNDVYNISALKSLENLAELDLSYNKILFSEPIANLDKITQLNVHKNMLQDLTVIRNMKLFNCIESWALISKQDEPTQQDYENFCDGSELNVYQQIQTANENKKVNEELLYDSIMVQKFKAEVKDGKISFKGLKDLVSIAFLDQLKVTQIVADQCENVCFERPSKLVTSLEATNSKIQDLTGLELMKQLKKLNLSGNSIRDITAISSLTELTSLVLNHNDVYNISALKSLEKLAELDLSYNKILFSEPIANLDKITQLNVHKNMLQDLTVIRNMKLFNCIESWALISKQDEPTQQDYENFCDGSELNVYQQIQTANENKKVNEELLYDSIMVQKFKAEVKDGKISFKGLKDLVSIAFLDQLKVTQIVADQCENVCFERPSKLVTSLEATNSKIQDLTGLELMKQLKKLNLSGNSIRDITAISSLTELTSLVLNHNDVYNISALKSLEKLAELDLSYNKIIFSEPIANLDKITQLNVHKNMLQDLTVIRNMKLFNCIESWALISKQDEPTQQDYELFCENQDLKPENLVKIVDLNSMSNFELVYDAEMISQYKSNKNELTITNDNKLASIAFMDQMPVKKLTLVNCQNISFNRTPKKLNQLTAVSCKLNQVDGIQNMNQLLQLNLGLNALNDSSLTYIAQLQKLELLDISQNRFQDISELSSLINIKTLDVNQNKIKNVTCVQQMTKLENLDISHNLIESINPLEGLVELQSLDISQNKIYSIAKLENLTQLKYFNISFNRIIEVAVCKKFEKLTKLITNGNIVQDFYNIMSHKNSRKCWETQQNLPTDEDYANAGLDDSKIIIEKNVKMLEKFQSQVVNNKLVIKNDPEVINLVFTDAYKLMKLTVEDCCKGDMDYLTFDMQSTTVEILNIKNCKLHVITDIYNMSQLVELDLSFNNLSNIEELGALENLQKLNLERNTISRIFYLEQLKQLNYLNISNNKVIMCAPLQKLNVQTLLTSNNMIYDQFNLQNLKNFNKNMLQIQLTPTVPDFEYHLGPNSTKQQAQELMAKTFKDYDDFMSDKYKGSVKYGKLNINNDLLLCNFNFTDQLNITDLSIVGCPNVKFDRVPDQILSLVVNNCDLYHVNGVAQLKKLKALDLNNNKCVIIESVAQLTNLTSFSVDNNFIQDINSLRSLAVFTPDIVYYQNAPLNSDIANYLRSINSTQSVLEFKDSIKQNQIQTEELFRQCGVLENYNYDQQMKNKYSAAVSYYKLSISSDQNLKSLRFVDELNITELNISHCNNVQFLRTPKKIVKLQVTSCELKNVNGIEKMNQLQYLNLSGNQISNVDALSMLVNLNTLYLQSNKIIQINALRDLKNLKDLAIYRNKICDFSPIRKHPNRKNYHHFNELSSYQTHPTRQEIEDSLK